MDFSECLVVVLLVDGGGQRAVAAGLLFEKLKERVLVALVRDPERELSFEFAREMAECKLATELDPSQHRVHQIGEAALAGLSFGQAGWEPGRAEGSGVKAFVLDNGHALAVGQVVMGLEEHGFRCSASCLVPGSLVHARGSALVVGVIGPGYLNGILEPLLELHRDGCPVLLIELITSPSAPPTAQSASELAMKVTSELTQLSISHATVQQSVWFPGDGPDQLSWRAQGMAAAAKRAMQAARNSQEIQALRRGNSELLDKVTAMAEAQAEHEADIRSGNNRETHVTVRVSPTAELNLAFVERSEPMVSSARKSLWDFF
eukprot:TRINITY_DN44989_c0_g2_i3.p1 TRINITY_DN44989_c0_g2~~TRINITY_DN44989_c0_g2_i3.p1  ORF type:complete len:319 (+),score=66.38 TRINITY_DN44989_c0_g2_i3:197-1153(+)